MRRDRRRWRERSPTPKHSPPTKPPRRHVLMDFESPVRGIRLWLPTRHVRLSAGSGDYVSGPYLSSLFVIQQCQLTCFFRFVDYPCASIFNLDDFTISARMESFPEVQGGGSLILAWQIRNKRVLVVGGGEVSD